MLAPLVAVGLTLWLISQSEKEDSKYPHAMYDCESGKKYMAKTETQHNKYAALGYVHSLDECLIPGGVPTPSPTPTNPTPTTKYTWSGEYAVSGPGGENVVWSFDTGSSQYWVIGNKTHTSFLSANSSRGTTTIPKEATGNERSSRNVVIFPGLEEASARADELSNPPPRDPTDPVQPQPQPEEEEEKDDGGFGGLPAAPGYQLGQGMGSFSM